MAKKKRKVSIAKLKLELERLKIKAPRMGVLPSKVIPDKTKYNRKTKHKAKI